MERYLKCTVVEKGDNFEVEVDIHGVKGYELLAIIDSLKEVARKAQCCTELPTRI